MALKYIDSFGYASDGAHTNVAGDDIQIASISYSNLTVATVENTTAGTRKYIQFPRGFVFRPNIYLNSDTVVVGFRLQFDMIGYQFLNIKNSSGSVICTLLTDSSGYLYLSPNTTKSSVPISGGTWNYIELKVVLDGAVGSVDVWLNGVSVLSVSNVDTEAAAGPATQVQFIADGSYSGAWARFMDIYIDDAVRHGPQYVYYQPADTAGSTANFTPLSGTNQSNVDEIGNDGDTTYNHSSVVGDYDRLTTSKTISGAVTAVQTLALARVESPGVATMKVGVRSDVSGTPTESLGTDTGLAEDWTPVVGSIEVTDPDTGSAWAAAAVNAAEIVYKHES